MVIQLLNINKFFIYALNEQFFLCALGKSCPQDLSISHDLLDKNSQVFHALAKKG